MIKILREDENYPKLLREIKQPPNQIYAIGDVSLLNTKCIAIVGSRNCTEYGQRMTYKFGKELCEYGFTIVSGLAIGVDSYAHKAAINNGGKTIAVLPCGLENIYPKENEELFKQIIQNGGCVISEYAPKTKSSYDKYVKRNRIVAGLSLGTLVVEGAYRSGTSITAGIAQNNGRKVFCIPSSLDNPKGFTPNWLIQKGASLVISVEDILIQIENKKWEKLNMREHNIKENKTKIQTQVNEEIKEENIKRKEIPQDYQELYGIIEKEENIHLNDIVKKSNQEISQINYQLTMLEIEGIIAQLPGKRFKIIE